MYRSGVFYEIGNPQRYCGDGSASLKVVTESDLGDELSLISKSVWQSDVFESHGPLQLASACTSVLATQKSRNVQLAEPETASIHPESQYGFHDLLLVYTICSIREFGSAKGV